LNTGSPVKTKALFYLAVILGTVFQCCKEHPSTIIKENQSGSKYAKNWDIMVIGLGDKKITCYHFENSAEFKKYNYPDSLTNNIKTEIVPASKTENIHLTVEEEDSIYSWANKLIVDPALPEEFCTDYVGYLKLTIWYGQEVKKSCEYISICDWINLSPETIKLSQLFKKKFRSFD
jgi:hypothetical protein